jgi:hypothetical protein
LKPVLAGFLGYFGVMANEAGLKNHLKRLILWAGLFLVILLTVFSIYGAFIGADKAKQFFNSVPLTVYWLAFAVVLISAIPAFRRLISSPASFLTHFGCILIIAGALWGSQAGFKIRHSLFHTGLIRSGEMIIREGETQKIVMTESEGEGKLPFAIKLVDFKIEYYQPGRLIIKTPQGTGFKLSAETGKNYDLGPDLGSVEIVRRFDHFRMLLEGDKKTAIDDPNPGAPENPALELRLMDPNGGEKTRYVFERFEGHRHTDNLVFAYKKTIRDFISDVEVIKDGSVIVRKSIEVNKPLHFGGYRFYQQGYDEIAGAYTVLGVVGDNGLGVVYIGYILLCAGVFWRLWFRHVFGNSPGAPGED